jgi:hypothetical protein
MQFAGASSTGDRRRRRLAVCGDSPEVDPVSMDGDGAEIQSQLVASAAAAPWVPTRELRIWIYASLMAIPLILISLALIYPLSLSSDLQRIADRLLSASRPRLLIVAQTLLLALSTQMGLMIGWYRSRCKLDFAGRYRVWPWAVSLFGIATFCSATNIHQTFGEIAARHGWFNWRSETVAWALPFCLMGLPLTLLLDRDVRNSRSSLFTLRASGALWLAAALFQLYQPELQSYRWSSVLQQLLPLYASAALFVGLWLHARIVAYVCPDPPKLEEQSAWSLLAGGLRWLAKRLVRRAVVSAEPLALDEVKPKRRRKKADVEEEAISDEEEAPPKRKRKAPAKRATTRTRTRTRPPEPEIEESEEIAEETSYDESESVEEAYESSENEVTSTYEEQEEQEEWNQETDEEEAQEEPVTESRGNGRFIQVHNSHQSAIPAPHSNPAEPEWQDEAESQESTSEYQEDSDEDQETSSESNADSMKGLSKRQRRELKKQQRDRERSRGR